MLFRLRVRFQVYKHFPCRKRSCDVEADGFSPRLVLVVRTETVADTWLSRTLKRLFLYAERERCKCRARGGGGEEGGRDARDVIPCYAFVLTVLRHCPAGVSAALAS